MIPLSITSHEHFLFSMESGLLFPIFIFLSFTEGPSYLDVSVLFVPSLYCFFFCLIPSSQESGNTPNSKMKLKNATLHCIMLWTVAYNTIIKVCFIGFKIFYTFHFLKY